MNKRLHDLIRFLSSRGFETTRCETGNGTKHVKLHLRSDGHDVRLFVSRSPSEHERRWHRIVLNDAKVALRVARERDTQAAKNKVTP